MTIASPYAVFSAATSGWTWPQPHLARPQTAADGARMLRQQVCPPPAASQRWPVMVQGELFQLA